MRPTGRTTRPTRFRPLLLCLRSRVDARGLTIDTQMLSVPLIVTLDAFPPAPARDEHDRFGMLTSQLLYFSSFRHFSPSSNEQVPLQSSRSHFAVPSAAPPSRQRRAHRAIPPSRRRVESELMPTGRAISFTACRCVHDPSRRRGSLDSAARDVLLLGRYSFFRPPHASTSRPDPGSSRGDRTLAQLRHPDGALLSGCRARIHFTCC